MRSILITAPLFLFSISVFSQNGKISDRISTVKKEKLNVIKFMSDIDSSYPKEYYNTIVDYVSVNILCDCGGKDLMSKGNSDTLTTEQRNILKKADVGSIIGAEIHFKYKDQKNDDIGSSRKIKEMSFAVKVVD